MRRINLFIIGFGIVVIGYMGACAAKKTTSNECAGFLTGYAKDVKPILDANCAGTCHSAEKKAAGIDLSSYEKVKEISKEGRFLGAIRHLAGFDPMPMKSPKLSDSSIKIISCWVKNGTPE